MQKTHLVRIIVVTAGLVGGWCIPDSLAEEPPASPAHHNPAAPAAKPSTDAPSTDTAASDRSEAEYYEIFSLLVDTIDQVERNYVKPIPRRELVEAAIQGILHKLDPYSSYIAPEDITRFRTSVENQFGGIGIQVTLDKGVLKVASPLMGSPAYRAGLQAGDRIVEIDGTSTDGMSIDDAVKQLKGEIGTPATIRVLGPQDADSRAVTLKREMIHLETVLGDVRKSDDRWDFMVDPQHEIAYIRLISFGRDTADELRQVLSELKNQGLRGLVLDLRFNPGGLLTSAVEVSDLFLAAGQIVSTSGRNIEARSWDAKAENDFQDFPMVVLVNRYSASSSEIVAACLQDHKRAVVIGERTWGKGSVQNVVEMENGKSALKLTTASYLRPSGKNIHRFPGAEEKDEWGVVPDDGFLIKSGDQELHQLVENRRKRDIIVRKSQAGVTLAAADAPKADETPPTDTSPDATAKPEDTAKPDDPAKPDETAKPEEPANSDPAEPNPAESEPAETGPADLGDPVKSGDSEQTPPAEEATRDKVPQTAPAKAPATTDQPADTKSESSPAEADKEADREKTPSFNDRQLAKALEYLRQQLSEAKSE